MGYGTDVRRACEEPCCRPLTFNRLRHQPISKPGTCEHCLENWNLYLEAKLDVDATKSHWCELESVAVTAEHLASQTKKGFDAFCGARTLVREAASLARQQADDAEKEMTLAANRLVPLVMKAPVCMWRIEKDNRSKWILQPPRNQPLLNVFVFVCFFFFFPV